MIETPGTEQDTSTTSNQSIHPLSQELKDMPFLQEEPAHETVAVAPQVAKDANIGAMLKRVREEKGHSTKVVSQQTKSTYRDWETVS